jgi:hypothetical protein
MNRTCTASYLLKLLTHNFALAIKLSPRFLRFVIFDASLSKKSQLLGFILTIFLISQSLPPIMFVISSSRLI